MNIGKIMISFKLLFPMLLILFISACNSIPFVTKGVAIAKHQQGIEADEAAKENDKSIKKNVKECVNE